MRVLPVPCLRDNYAYVVTDGAGFTFVVDPSEADPVHRALLGEGLALHAILCTHHHHDHVGGNLALAEATGAPIVGFAGDAHRIPGISRPLAAGATFDLGTMGCKVHHIPGHTLGALAYEVHGHEGPPALFTGDTLFVGGCGRLFEGTPTMMHRSLQHLAGLAPEAAVYCGHEYTEANLRFAHGLLPDDAAIAAKLDAVTERRRRGEPTVPSTVAEERATNLFLRVGEAVVRAALGVPPGASDEDAFRIARARKDHA